jgi:hypothetical protein
VINKVPFFQDLEYLSFPKDSTTASRGGVYKVFIDGNEVTDIVGNRMKSNISDDLFMKFYKIKKFKFDNNNQTEIVKYM